MVTRVPITEIDVVVVLTICLIGAAMADLIRVGPVTRTARTAHRWAAERRTRRQVEQRLRDQQDD